MNLDQDMEIYQEVRRLPQGIFTDPREVKRLERHIREYHGVDPATGSLLGKEAKNRGHEGGP